MRLLYLYPEEWQGRRAREIHTLSTCVALAQAGVEVTLTTAGGAARLEKHLREIAGAEPPPNFRFVALTRGVGPLRSTAVFAPIFRLWLRRQPRFDAAFAIHLKAAALLTRAALPYLYEAHEIFAETPRQNPTRQQELHAQEHAALAGATWRVATSKALATGLRAHYTLPNDFTIVPNAGLPPLPRSLAAPDGPFVYAGSIADWKGLELIIAASHAAAVPLRLIGGTDAEWKDLARTLPAAHVDWRPRVPLDALPDALAGARAGLIPTRSDTPSGRYSCPMKIFDYARCGLPVLTSALPALDSLQAGSWCVRVESPRLDAWTHALQTFTASPVLAETARAWANAHTWTQRAEKLLRLLF
jgi:glycosyltransferase involved in cell wall biosynthesis